MNYPLSTIAHTVVNNVKSNLFCNSILNYCNAFLRYRLYIVSFVNKSLILKYFFDYLCNKQIFRPRFLIDRHETNTTAITDPW